MPHYSKNLVLRAWAIVRRPVWRWVVSIGAFASFLQFVAPYFAERLVGIFDALSQWWYVPISVLALCVFLRAGYELWKDEERARKKAEGQLREAEQEHKRLETTLREAESERKELKEKLEELASLESKDD